MGYNKFARTQCYEQPSHNITMHPEIFHTDLINLQIIDNWSGLRQRFRTQAFPKVNF